MALAVAVQEALYLKRLMLEFKERKECSSSPVVIHEDNQGCIALANNPVYQQRTKHIDVKFHFIREAMETGETKLTFCPTDKMLADILTKPIEGERLSYLRARVLGEELT